MEKRPRSERPQPSSHRNQKDRTHPLPAESDLDSAEAVIDLSDTAAARRDSAARSRDKAAQTRDQRARERDQAATERDEYARTLETPGQGDALDGTNSIRLAAKSDRSKAEDDRRRAGDDRLQAAADRSTASDERQGAGIDELTGALMRGPGFLELEREEARARRSGESLVLAFLDVDGLKAINDSLGHAAGDRALREVARVVRNHLRAYDPFFRYGGDEFVCALAGASRSDAAERLSGINVVLAEGPEHMSITIGLSELQPGENVEDAVARADQDLYQQRQRRPASN